MRILISKLNIWHIVILFILPILLALINPNWIFNTFIIDDYIYLGYQIDLPGYARSEPSNSYYFIDRISWFIPTYYIRQIITSPLLANFVIHLGVYYLAIFSVYGILNRLFQARIALFTTILMGQFSLFLRATGWDYVDGYSLALLSLCVLLLTYAATSPHAHGYWVGAGAIAIIMVVAQFFNLLYLPAIGIYYLFLNHQHYRHHFLKALCYVGLGVTILFIIQTLFYYQLTGNWFIWQNTIAVLDGGQVIGRWRNLVAINYTNTVFSWHIFYMCVAIISSGAIIGFNRFKQIYGENTPHFRHHLKATVMLFLLSYGVLWAWWLIFNYDIFRLSFYNTLIIPSLFCVVGALFAGRVYRLTNQQFRSIIILALLIPTMCFALYTQLSEFQLLLLWLIALFIGLLLFIFSFMAKRQISIAHFIVAFALLNLVSGIDNYYIGVFLKDRYENQRIYEIVIEAASIINQRYDNYNLETFRFWYDNTDKNKQTIFSLTSIYMHQWGRRIEPMNSGENKNPRWDDDLYTTSEIIMVSTEHAPDTIVEMGNAILRPLGYELMIMHTAQVEKIGRQLQLVFTQLRPLDITSN